MSNWYQYHTKKTNTFQHMPKTHQEHTKNIPSTYTYQNHYNNISQISKIWQTHTNNKRKHTKHIPKSCQQHWQIRSKNISKTYQSVFQTHTKGMPKHTINIASTYQTHTKNITKDSKGRSKTYKHTLKHFKVIPKSTKDIKNIPNTDRTHTKQL